MSSRNERLLRMNKAGFDLNGLKHEARLNRGEFSVSEAKRSVTEAYREEERSRFPSARALRRYKKFMAAHPSSNEQVRLSILRDVLKHERPGMEAMRLVRARYSAFLEEQRNTSVGEIDSWKHRSRTDTAPVSPDRLWQSL